MGTKPYCGDCPDPEACHQGASCDYVRKVAAYFNHLDAVMTGKGNTIMANTGSKITVTPADVAEQAKEEKLVTEVPAQGGKEEKATGDSTTKEKAKEVVEETAEVAKKTVKDRVSGLIEKAKKNKQFFLGVVAGSVSTALAIAVLAKEKVEEVVELTIADEPEPEIEIADDEPTV